MKEEEECPSSLKRTTFVVEDIDLVHLLPDLPVHNRKDYFYCRKENRAENSEISSHGIMPHSHFCM